MLVSGGENGLKKFAFIHIQKTGGDSIEKLLRAAFPGLTSFDPRHMGALRAREEIEDWDEYYSFAFVRNPWDRLVSWYCMLDSMRRLGPKAPWWAQPPHDSPLLRYVREEAPTFEEFIKGCTREFEVRGEVYSFTRNQLDYLVDKNGELLVDFVGKVERFDEDLATVLGEIGLDVPANAIPHANRFEHGHYSTFYTPETESIVRARFAQDIEYFAYEFEAGRR